MYEFERMVYHCDTGSDGLLKLEPATAMMMDCCQFQEYAEPAFCRWLRENNTAVFLASMQLDIFRRPAFREKLKVRVVIYDCQSIYGFRRITIRDEEGKLCMISNAIGCFFSFSTGRAVKLPDNIEDYLKYDPEEPAMEVLPRKILTPPEEGIASPDPYRVYPSALDLNGHLTSARYFSLAEDRLPRDFQYNRVRVEFKHQVRVDSVITPWFVRTGENSIFCRLRDQENQLNAILEFSKF